MPRRTTLDHFRRIRAFLPSTRENPSGVLTILAPPPGLYLYYIGINTPNAMSAGGDVHVGPPRSQLIYGLSSFGRNSNGLLSIIK